MTTDALRSPRLLTRLSAKIVSIGHWARCYAGLPYRKPGTVLLMQSHNIRDGDNFSQRGV